MRDRGDETTDELRGEQDCFHFPKEEERSLLFWAPSLVLSTWANETAPRKKKKKGIFCQQENDNENEQSGVLGGVPSDLSTQGTVD